MEENFLFGTKSIILSNIKYFVVLISIVVIFTVLLGLFQDDTAGKNAANDMHASQGSVTSCIELDAIAHEIEITKSSIEKAARKLHNFLPHYTSNSDEAPKYCALKLV